MNRECFIPARELCSLKSFTTHILKVFPGGALFIACKEEEFKLFLIKITSDFLQEDIRRVAYLTHTIGRNVAPNNTIEWILAEDSRFSENGTSIPAGASQFVLATTNKKLSCSLSKPFDHGEALVTLYTAIEHFMTENAISCLACMSAFVMGAAYEQIIEVCGQMGVPFLYGDFGSCKSLASLCSLSLFGAHNSHVFNNQTTQSYLFEAMKSSTIPVFIDDIDKKSHDMWEELVVDIYNNTPRGTRAYGVERFRTTPIVSANWCFSNSAGRAFTRCIVIPFSLHQDEPNATELYSDLAQARKSASSSVGQIVQLCSSFQSQESQTFYHEEVFPGIAAIFRSSHARFKSTMSTFMWFFLKVSYTGCYIIIV